MIAQRIAFPIASSAFLALTISLIIIQAGCGHGAKNSGTAPAPPAAGNALSPDAAANLAARLANDQCERRYQRRPFKPEQHPAVLQKGIFHWGGLDVGGPGGFSALVTFRADGSDPHVEVYFSSDQLTPPRAPAPSPPARLPK